MIAWQWPTNDTVIGTSNFTLRGEVDDETATLTVSGGTFTNAGLVERRGVFWAEGLPLTNGANALTLTLTDFAGNVSNRTFNVTRGGVDLTLALAALTNRAVDVAGTISASGYAVWVNGVRASNLSGGNWVASNVPVQLAGGPTFAAVAIPLTNNGGAGTAPVTNGLSGAAAKNNPAALNPASPNSLHATADPEEPARVEYFHTGGAHSTAPAARPPTASAWRYWTPELEGWFAFISAPTGAAATNGPWSGETYYRGWLPAEESDWRWKTLDYSEENGLQVGDHSFEGFPTPDDAFHPGVWHEGYFTGTTTNGTVQRWASTIAVLHTGGRVGAGGDSALFRLAAQVSRATGLSEAPLPMPGGVPVPPELVTIQQRPADAAGQVFVNLAQNARVLLQVDAAVPAGNKYLGIILTPEKRIPEVRGVTFKMGGNNTTAIKWDTTAADTEYPVPHWNVVPTSVGLGIQNRSPVFYVAGQTLEADLDLYDRTDSTHTFGEPFVVEGEMGGYTLRGTNGPNGLKVKADRPLTINQVRYFDKAITWKMVAPTPRSLGVSQNQIYVSRASPAAPLYHTVVHLACSKDGATTDDQAVANTWSLFSGKAVKTWDNVELGYWVTNAGQTSFAPDTKGLLRQRSGDCKAFTRLFIDSLRVNGVPQVQEVEVVSSYSNQAGFQIDPRGMFLIKNWTFTSTGTAPTNCLPFTHQMTVTSPEAVEASGVAAQNNPDPRSAFVNHFVVAHGPQGAIKYFDPSYGTGPFYSAEQWEDASVAGYFKVFILNGIGVVGAKPNTTGQEVDFTHSNQY